MYPKPNLPNTYLMSEENKKVTLPENAFRELKPGEKYQPLLTQLSSD